MSKISLRGLHNKAWKVFSVWVRSKEADFSGYAKCFTCDKVFQWRDLDAGHFFHGRLDFDEMNVKPQCTGCNRFRHGKHNTYGIRLAKMYGVEAVEELERRSLKKGNNYSRKELEEIIKMYEMPTGQKEIQNIQ